MWTCSKDSVICVCVCVYVGGRKDIRVRKGEDR